MFYPTKTHSEPSVDEQVVSNLMQAVRLFGQHFRCGTQALEITINEMVDISVNSRPQLTEDQEVELIVARLEELSDQAENQYLAEVS